MRDIPTGRPPSHYHGRHLLNRGIMSLLLLLLHWPCTGLQWILEHCTSSSTGREGMELSRCKGRIKEFVTLGKKFIRGWAGETRGEGVRYPQFNADCQKQGQHFDLSPIKNKNWKLFRRSVYWWGWQRFPSSKLDIIRSNYVGVLNNQFTNVNGLKISRPHPH